MNTQYSTPISLTDSSFHLSSSLLQRQLSGAGRLTQRQQKICDPRLDAAAFERFLYWLSPDLDTAGLKYESIRSQLIRMFRARRCVFPEDLADATFERVERKLTNITEFTGNPASYIYGVAKKIYLEHRREFRASHRRSGYLLPTNTYDPNLENMLKQLDKALNTIQPADRDLILRYYTPNENKIHYRRALAAQVGIQPNALRLRVFRIKRKIKNHMLRQQLILPSNC